MLRSSYHIARALLCSLACPSQQPAMSCHLGACLASPEFVYSFFCVLTEAFHAAKLIAMIVISVWLQGFPQLEVSQNFDLKGPVHTLHVTSVTNLCRSLRDSSFLEAPVGVDTWTSCCILSRTYH